jgi:hypothetical protein
MPGRTWRTSPCKFVVRASAPVQTRSHRWSATTEEGTMTLHKLGQDPESPDGKSPTVYLDDRTGNYVLQGFKVTDPERLAQMDIPAHETVIEFPRRMMQFFPEVKGSTDA